MSLDVRPATADRWDDVVKVMGERGDPSRCFCQYFRLRGKEWSEADSSSHRSALRDQVRSDRAPGVLATDASGTPIGWCAVAPRAAYPRVVASSNWRGGDPDAWAVTCFVVLVGHRRQGVTGELLEGAISFARDQGARTLEACAVDTAQAGKVPAANLYRGPLSTYLAAGFKELSRTSPSWVLVRRSLRP
jgi:GNAT superfamily N-acetyltransferase